MRNCLAAMYNSMNDNSMEEYPDKAQVSFVKDPSKLTKYFKNRPEELDEVIQHLGNALNSTKQVDELVVVELHLEERSKSHDPVNFRCCPKWSVLTTKFKICDLYPNYTTQNLFLLFRRRIAKDWMYLRECGVEQNGDALYVYISTLQPRSALSMQSRHTPFSSGSGSNPGTIEMPTMPQPSTNQMEQSFQNFFELPPDGLGPGTFEFTSGADFPMAGPPDGNVKLWVCKTCTFLNEDWRNDCCMCSSPRPVDNTKPLEFQQTTQTFTPLEPNSLIFDKPPPLEVKKVGWMCPGCTFVNEPTRPGCEMCSVPRPADYAVPEGHQPSEKELERMRKETEVEQAAAEQRSFERQENYTKHLSVVEQNIINSAEPIECMICFTEADPLDSIVLRECLHKFCKNCISEHVKRSEEAIVTCPYMDDNYKCNNAITHLEIKALLSEEDFKKFLDRGLMQAEKESPNSFHCKTPDCKGWCVYEDQVNNFHCPVCNRTNCLTCKAIHEDKNCKEYQEEITRKAATDEEAKKTKQVLDKMLKDGDAMQCPQCNIIIQKKVGCDWIRCPMCKLEICWVTKGPRWGPGGHGDNSGGCRCRVGGKRCHNDCNNCH